MTTTFIGILSVMLASEATPTAAAPAPAATAASDAVQARTAIRANGMVGLDFGAVGFEVSHGFNRHVAVEGAIDGVAMSRGNGGMYGQVLLRAGFSGVRHGINVGIGPGLFDSPAFGAVTFLVPELAYEYRPLRGFSLAAGVGLPVVLNDSREVPCQETGLLSCLFETTQFHRGDASPRVRLALGYSF